MLLGELTSLTTCPRCGFSIAIHPNQEYTKCKNCEKKISLKINEFEGEKEMVNKEIKSTIEMDILGTNIQNAVYTISKEQIERAEFDNWKATQTPQEDELLIYKDTRYIFRNGAYLCLDRVQDKNLFFAKVRETATIPTKEDENMGYDIYADFEEDYMLIYPHETKMIPTGICSACSEDYAIVLKERGSTGTKGIAQRCGVIDSGYRAEWFVPITNTTNIPIVISKKLDDKMKKKFIYGEITVYPYEKAICQAVVLPVPKMNVQEISLEMLKSIPSKRKDGKIGSSGK